MRTTDNRNGRPGPDRGRSSNHRSIASSQRSGSSRSPARDPGPSTTDGGPSLELGDAGAETMRWARSISITPAKRKAATALVKQGIAVSLASNAFTTKGIDVPCPVRMGDGYRVAGRRDGPSRVPRAFTEPARHISIHSPTDSSDGKMWNGHPASELVTIGRRGAARNSIPTMKNGIVTRGILHDIPRLKGVPYLEPERESFRRIRSLGKESGRQG